jgi:hypothetical protein
MSGWINSTRPELAKAEAALREAHAEIGQLKANHEAELAGYRVTLTEAYIVKDLLRADIERLRALLRQAREWLDPKMWEAQSGALCKDLCDRIDAELGHVPDA